MGAVNSAIEKVQDGIETAIAKARAPGSDLNWSGMPDRAAERAQAERNRLQQQADQTAAEEVRTREAAANIAALAKQQEYESKKLQEDAAVEQKRIECVAAAAESERQLRLAQIPNAVHAQAAALNAVHHNNPSPPPPPPPPPSPPQNNPP
jgi:hypothetical protein